MKKLDKKVTVITGGTFGMGLATAKRFVAEGAYVFIMGRRQRELDAAVKDIGSRVKGVQGDIAKLTDLDRLHEIVKSQKGRGVSTLSLPTRGLVSSRPIEICH